jgi:RNA polymerase sigma factor (sigma-70 family)
MTKTARSSFEKYLSEVAGHKLLGKEGEIALAQEIEQLEVAAWSLLLRHKPAAPFLGDHGIDQSETAAAMRAADRERERFTKMLHILDSHLEGRKRWAIRRKEIACLELLAQRARQKFMQGNLKLVVKIASKFNNRGLALEDLVQEGNLGLVKAIDKYEYQRGFRFSTYATWWIKHAVQRAVLNTAHTVRRPVHIQELVMKIMRVQTQITSEKRREPTDEEVAEMLEVPVSKIRSVRVHVQASATRSIDVDPDDEDTTPLQLASDDTSPLDTLIQSQDERRVAAMLRTLKPIQADVLRRRFGLGGAESVTLSKIGKDLGLSRERIRQLQNEALDNLRANL